MYVVLYLYIVLFNDICCIIFVYCFDLTMYVVYICILFCLMMYVVLYLYIVLFNDACLYIYMY